MQSEYFKPIEYKMLDKKIAYQGKGISVEEVNMLLLEMQQLF